MKKFILFIREHKLLFELTVLFTCCSLATTAQKSFLDKMKDRMSKTKDIISSTTQLVSTADVLIKATKMTAGEFNKKVTVVKGDTGRAANVTIPANVTKPKIENGKFTNLNWEAISYFDTQLFPSAIISMATYNGTLTPLLEAISRPLGFSIVSSQYNIPLKWEIESNDKTYFDKISGSFVYEQPNKIVDLMPVIPWNYEALAKHNTTKPLSVYFRLYDEDGNKVEKLLQLSLRSINDCISYYKDLNLQFMFDAYVQEEDPEIDNILRAAINTRMVNEFIGYQNEVNEKDDRFTMVDLQVAAIWRVLHDRGFVYSSITTTTGDQGDIHSQVVRTFDNALKTNQANCVDGTVVFASILRKIGINPFMILVPGHCFLGYSIDKDKTKYHFLETTMLSDDTYLAKAKTATEKQKAYISEFLEAQDYAAKEYEKYSSDKSVNAIDVSEYRKLIKPIPIYN